MIFSNEKSYKPHFKCSDPLIFKAQDFSSVDQTIGGDDRLFGASGRDFIVGGAGRDVLMSTEGVDVFIGGDGDEFIWRKAA